MKLGTPECPHCGEPACHIEETMLCRYEIGQFENVEHQDAATGQYDYTGEYEDFSDTAQPHMVDGTVEVACHNRHTWRTTIEGHDEPKEGTAAWIIATMTTHRMAVRWSYHKRAWVGSMLHVETGNECQFVADSIGLAVQGAHKKATTPKVKK